VFKDVGVAVMNGGIDGSFVSFKSGVSFFFFAFFVNQLIIYYFYSLRLVLLDIINMII
jgi:hypothetical protein